MLAVAVRLGLDVSDLLGFLGALVGAAAAVWGAIYAEDRRRLRFHFSERSHLLAALKHYRQGLNVSSNVLEAGVIGSRLDFEPVLSASAREVALVHQVIQSAMDKGTTLSLGDHLTVREMDHIGTIIPGFLRALENPAAYREANEIYRARENLANWITAVTAAEQQFRSPPL